MLPFLKPKSHQQAGSLTIVERNPEVDDRGSEDESMDPAMEAAAQDILTAIHAKDVKHLALALKALFEIVDSQPHEEGPHLNELE